MNPTKYIQDYYMKNTQQAFYVPIIHPRNWEHR